MLWIVLSCFFFNENAAGNDKLICYKVLVLLVRLESLLHASGLGAQRRVDLSWWGTDNKRDNGITGSLDVLERSEDMNTTINIGRRG